VNGAWRTLLFEPLFLSWSQSFLLLNGVLLLVVLPASLPIRLAAHTASIASFFPHVYLVLFALYAVNFGQTQASSKRIWRQQLGLDFVAHVRQLGLRLSAMLLLSVPFWIVFYQAFYLRWTVILALVHLWLQAQLWGWFGLWLGLTGFSEINQFKLKYVALVAYFSLTFFVPPLSPFLTLQLLLDPNVQGDSSVEVGLALVAVFVLFGVLGWGMKRRMRTLERRAIPGDTP